MNRSKLHFFLIFLLIIPIFSAAAGSDHVRIRTFAGMDPYGRMTVKNWNAGETQRWNASYGITPGIEAFGIINEWLEIGGGVRYQVPRRVYSVTGADGEKFSYIPLYAAGRFSMVNSVGVDLYAVVRLGYTFLTANQAFMDIWLDEIEGTSLESITGGLYAGGSIGVIFNLLQREGWGLDFSMDAGYAFHGGTGRADSGKGFAVSYQAFTVDFALDWRF